MDDEEVKGRECPKCKTYRTNGSFFRIVTRKNHAPGCDDEGNTAYIKPTKLCSECRLRQSTIMNKRNNMKRANKEDRINNSWYYENN
jgi:predicted RNA-binding protein YlxR (DUF448 family)